MSSKHVSESDPTLANRFLTHKLSDAERVMLEAELMVDPGAVQELENTARLKVGLQRLRESGELDALLAQPARHNRFPVSGALAASVTVAALLLGAMLIAPSPQLLTTVDGPHGADAAARSYPHSYLVTVRRSAANRTVIERPGAGEAIRLNILPATELPPPFRVSLREENTRKTLGEITVPAAQGNYVSVAVAAAQLEPGSYELILTGLGAPSKPQEQFLLEVRAAATESATR